MVARSLLAVVALPVCAVVAFRAPPAPARSVVGGRVIERRSAEMPTDDVATVALSDEPIPVVTPPPEPAFDITSLPGVSAPFGFFDPLGLSKGLSEERALYFREAELKHGRVAMLAAFGFPVAERFHPLFGGDIDVPSYVAYQQTPLQTFWPVVVLYVGFVELFSVFTFESPFDGALWTIKKNHVSGDFDFDPLDLKPSDPAAYAAMCTKELNNGRLAMIAIAGMVGQELATGAKLFS